MINSAILEVVIGLIFIYWLLALVCSTVNELIVGLLGLRARELQIGIRMLLNGGEKRSDKPVTPEGDFVNKVLTHSLIRGITNHKQIKIDGIVALGPSYIPARTFANAVFDTLFSIEGSTPMLAKQIRTLTKEGKIPEGVQAMLKVSTDQARSKLTGELQRLIADANVKDNVKKVLGDVLKLSDDLITDQSRKLLSDLTIPDDVRNLLTNYLNQADASLEQFRSNLEQWFNDSMDRVSGWYKRTTQFFIAGIAAIACVVFNIDTLAVANHLYRAPADRAALVALSETVAKEGGAKETDPQKRIEEILQLTDKAAVAQIGWPQGFNLLQMPFGERLLKVLGWALSTIAALFGAPFWFDLLKKSLNMRNAGEKPKTEAASSAAE